MRVTKADSDKQLPTLKGSYLVIAREAGLGLFVATAEQLGPNSRDDSTIVIFNPFAALH